MVIGDGGDELLRVPERNQVSSERMLNGSIGKHNGRRFMGEIGRLGSQLTLRDRLSGGEEVIVATRPMCHTDTLLFKLKVLVIYTTEDSLRTNTWREIERIQALSVHDEDNIGRTLILDPGCSNTPYTLCALQVSSGFRHSFNSRSHVIECCLPVGAGEICGSLALPHSLPPCLMRMLGLTGEGAGKHGYERQWSLGTSGVPLCQTARAH